MGNSIESVDSNHALTSLKSPNMSPLSDVKNKATGVERSVTNHEVQSDFSVDQLAEAAKAVETVVNSASETSLSFSLVPELNRMVVSVREVGSDEIVRQFPPEEFLTVAKFIAAQNPEELSEDFLKGLLFDQRT